MFELICNGLFTLLGVFIGWFLNQVSSARQARPRLCFSLCNTSQDELIEKELRTKTSTSDYGIEIYNVGQTPFILDYFELCHKRKLVVDCRPSGEDSRILPYQSITDTLMEQESESLEWHCKQLDFSYCKVIAYSIDGKRVTGKLDVSLIQIRASVAREMASGANIVGKRG